MIRHDNTFLAIKCVHEMQEVRVMELISSFAREDIMHFIWRI